MDYYANLYKFELNKNIMTSLIANDCKEYFLNSQIFNPIQ